jgi:hypothetical protein
MTRRLIALAVVGTLIGSQCLAYADPPDPTWIAGFWDDADYDDVIVRITSRNTVAMPVFGALEPCWISIQAVPLVDDPQAPRPAAPPRPSRGPPAA